MKKLLFSHNLDKNSFNKIINVNCVNQIVKTYFLTYGETPETLPDHGHARTVRGNLNLVSSKRSVA